MRNIVIFGGAFDPIHNGHINMAISASEALNAEVFFVPARISIWKKESISSVDKLEMIKLAIKDSGREDILKISTCELDSDKDTNYSIDTVKYFKEKYKDANLYFLIGTDQVNKFEQWRECDSIASLAHIVFFSRPGYEISKDNINRFKMMEIEGELFDVSSTDIREMRSLDVLPSVLNYIIDKRLYFVGKIKSYLKEKRFLHSVSVAKLAYEIAISNKLSDSARYLIAGLIHDIGKEIPREDHDKIMKENYKQYINFPYPVQHQFVGEYIAKRDFDIKDEDILAAIKYHTTGRANMSMVEKCIYASDKIEPTRGFDSSDLINAMKVNINNGFITVLKANQEYFIEKKIPYDNALTAECFDYYLR